MSEFTPKLDRIAEDEWETVVRNVPIVSIDLVVRSPDGIVLGKRTNEPAKGEWFVPGGRVHKHERLVDAARRVASDELGVKVEVIGELGAYEHLYHEAELDGDGKHYLANGFVVETDVGIDEMELDDQHDGLRAFEPADLPTDLHEYTAAYLRDSNSIEFPPE
ncbi:NUDIX domain-containing protein [Haloarchaeobius amylolyticus]|uniref:NUDIX domain-containing protein n=1 Tax=Haloarchaeobius amylolyticus TaxID=1198296 RepID=UPI00226E5FAE|nr:NUDIX domain-containing protein [Haloarchaeobius amylolyticus]